MKTIRFLSEDVSIWFIFSSIVGVDWVNKIAFRVQHCSVPFTTYKWFIYIDSYDYFMFPSV